MKTFILAIFGLLALANAQDMEYKIDQSEARKANPEPEKAYAHPGYKPPAKRLAKRAAAAYAQPNDFYVADASMGPVLAKTNKEAGLERLAKRDAVAYPSQYYGY